MKKGYKDNIAPPHHKDGIARFTREEAMADGPEFDGTTTE